MRILPVIDILRGVVVRGVAGRREEYRPLKSRWTESTDPVAVAEALQRAFGFRRFYVADLDGILSGEPNQGIYRRLVDAGFELLIDAGASDIAGAAAILDFGSAIIGLETLRNPESLGEMIREFGPEKIVFSLDLRGGKPNLPDGAFVAWASGPRARRRDAAATASMPECIAADAIELGVRRMIVLDLADVGTGTGGSTAVLCQTIRTQHPHVAVITGGGVRGPDDVRRWAQTGVSELLIASALHDGRLLPDDVAHVSNV